MLWLERVRCINLCAGTCGVYLQNQHTIGLRGDGQVAAADEMLMSWHG